MKYIVVLIFLFYSLAMFFTKNIGVKEFYLTASMFLAAEYIDFAFKRKEEE